MGYQNINDDDKIKNSLHENSIDAGDLRSHVIIVYF